MITTIAAAPSSSIRSRGMPARAPVADVSAGGSVPAPGAEVGVDMPRTVGTRPGVRLTRTG
ncbi:hypothetical protein Acsp06_37520 [Actinomycetospora sp. NBRC 106375]|nr:hypothetical protein Acsp06_37520 [Actinomycetospora sp. NBRC 106375]